MEKEGLVNFKRDGRKMLLIFEGKHHKIVRCAIIANITRDVCLARGDSPGDIKPAEIKDTPNERIVDIPDGDILWLQIDPPHNDKHSIFMTITEDMKPLIDEIFRIGLGKKGDLFDAYASMNYRKPA